MSNFLSNTRIFILKFSAGLAINRLREHKKKMRSLHLVNEGISDDAIHSMVFRDSEDQSREVMKLLQKIRKEKGKNKMLTEEEVLCS
jgi:hypothetical protein